MPLRFAPLPFERMSESDVREDVLVPLLSALGYRTGSQYDIRRELTLRYPRQSLGRKQQDRDPVLRGRADYVLRVNGELSWVLEAKSPVADIQADEIEQAWTYATHPEVRAAYFVLCNGKDLLVFDSFVPPDAREVLRLKYEELDQRFNEVLHILGPAAIERQIALRAANRGVPLGPGLGSVAQIASGLIKYFEPSKSDAVHPNIQTIVVGGTVERDESGFIVVHIDTQAPLPGMQEINDRIGFSGIDLRSNATSLPTASDAPIELHGSLAFTIPAGERLTLPGAPTTFTVPVNFECESQMVATGVLESGKFHGTWRGTMLIKGSGLPSMPLSGSFFVRLV
jgi:Type I restriction enzyme R protein N terminus (HSDR_N)